MKIKDKEDLSKFTSLMESIRDIRKDVRNHFMKKMKEHQIDMTIEMLDVLYILWEKDNINQREIVFKTNKDKASVTSLLDNLTKRGLVERKPDPSDKRNNLIALTKEGENYQAKLIPLLQEVYDLFLRDISSEELSHTIEVLQRIHQKMME